MIGSTRQRGGAWEAQVALKFRNADSFTKGGFKTQAAAVAHIAHVEPSLKVW